MSIIPDIKGIYCDLKGNPVVVDSTPDHVTPDTIIDAIMLMLAKGHKPKSVVLSQELHSLFMYTKHYRLPPLTERPEFFGLPCEVGAVDGFKIII